MHEVKATLDCLECFLRQALRAARIASDDPAVHRRILDETARRIPEMDLAKSPAVLSQVIYELTALFSGRPDPYCEHKRAQNALALALEPELRRLVSESADPLDTALHVAAAGNVIDLGTQHEDDIDVRAALDAVLRERFAVELQVGSESVQHRKPRVLAVAADYSRHARRASPG